MGKFITLREEFESETGAHPFANQQYIEWLEKLVERQRQVKNCSIPDVSKRSWHIGEKVVVTHCIYGHEFDNGTTVEIVDHEPSQTTSWLCSDGKCSWWLSEDEGYVC